MDRKRPRALDAAAERLRAISLEQDEGTFVGTEETLIGTLGASRSTVRQAARLLEREGLIEVKRGLNGGYFSARPDTATIEMVVSSYLQTLDMDPQDVTRVASALWMLVVRKVASNNEPETQAAIAKLTAAVEALTPDSTFAEVREVERQSHREMLRVSKSGYVKLIFDVNIAFSQRNFPLAAALDGTPFHREFVGAWRSAKLLELSLVAQGAAELAPLAAEQARRLWHGRIWYPPGDNSDLLMSGTD